MDRIGSSYPEVESQYNGSKASKVIWETQSHSKITNQKIMYKNIMTNIDLDSPNTSTESKRNEDSEKNQIALLVNTPIRNSTSNLMALRQHLFLPRWWRL
jgi:hypothetical protein